TVSADKDGKLTFDPAEPIPIIPGPERNDTGYTLVDVRIKPSGSAVYVTPLIVGTTDTASTGGSGGGRPRGGEGGRKKGGRKEEKKKKNTAPPHNTHSTGPT